MVTIIQRGLFWRVYLTLLGSLILVALIAATLWHWMAEQPMPAPMSYTGAALSALMPASDAPRPQMEQALQRLSTSIDARVLLIDAGGHLVGEALGGRILATPPMSGPTPTGAAAHLAKMRGWRVHLSDGRTLLVEQRPRFGGGGPHILGMLMAIAAAVGVAAYPIVSRLTRRLETLRSSLDAWGGGRLNSRAKVEGRDEIAAVAASFNAAADRVEALLAAHKALLAHASHELRSPLTRLRMAVEMYANQPDPSLRPAIIADIAELDGLVDEILLASRLDHSAARPEREIVDLLGLAAEEAARGGASIRHADAVSDFEIMGSGRLLRRMIRNLIENASRHGLPPVEVELDRSGAQVVIAVHDHGPGIPETERERVFEPFYRPSGRAESAGSWGLGLSIVRQIAEQHGGSVSCEGRVGGGGSFIAKLPMGLDRA